MVDLSLREQTSAWLGRIRCAAGTDVGRKREENQDSFGILKTDYFHLYLVADGMGGVKGGAIASRLAISTIEEGFRAARVLEASGIKEIVERANRAIFERGSSEPTLAGMGTTVVGLFFAGGQLSVFSVGDSRAYRIRGTEARQLTEDHTLVSELVRTGALSEDQAENHPVSHMLTRSLGPQAESEVDCWSLASDLDDGDVFLLCSDGLYNFIGPDELVAVVRENTIDDASQILINLANQRGGTDNITVLIVAYGVGASRVERINTRSSTSHEGEHQNTGHSELSGIEAEGIFEAVKDPPQKRRVPLVLVIAAALVFGLVVGRLYGRFTSEDRAQQAGKLQRLLDDEQRFLQVRATEPAPQIVAAEQQKTALPAPLSEIQRDIESSIESSSNAKSAEVSPRELERLEKTREAVRASISRVSSQLSQIDKPLSGVIAETLFKARKSVDELEGELLQIEQDIDKASRRLSQWYGRQKRLETQEPLNLAAEVGAASPSVQSYKEAFERATYEFIKRRDEYELYPSDERLRDQVLQLKSRRAEALKSLQAEVRKVVERLLADSDREIDELKFRREMTILQLETVRQDLDFARTMTEGSAASRESLKRRIDLRLDSLKASLVELDGLIEEKRAW